MSSAGLQEIEARISQLTPSEMLQLATELIERARRSGSEAQGVEWSRFQGALAQGPEPLEYQRVAREEWP